MNANDPKMGAEIFARALSKKSGIRINDLKKMQTHRPNGVPLRDCIFDYITFESKAFNDTLEVFKKRTVYEDETKKALDYSAIFQQMYFDFGLGGLHGCRKAGIYKSDINNVIMTCDVTSYYPNLSIVNRFYPQHLGPTYCDVYKELFIERGMYPKGTAENYGLKIALNGTFGKSNDQYSFFKDVKYMLTTTVNGQLLLAKLAEDLSKIGQILMVNTDGIEVKIPRSKMGDYQRICAKWEKLTRLQLEHGQYQMMVVRDVNNYMALSNTDEIKMKGVFDSDKPIWKDHSMRIVPLALHEYFINGVTVEDTIESHEDVYDFFKSFKSSYGWTIKYKIVDGQNVLTTKPGKTVRYYVSNKGGNLSKYHGDGRIVSLESGYSCMLMNQMQEMEMSQYGINYQYYINECNKIINAVSSNQMELFA